MNVFRLVLCLAGLVAYLIAKQSLPRAEANVPPTQVRDTMSTSAPFPAGSCRHHTEHDTHSTDKAATEAAESNKATR